MNCRIRSTVLSEHALAKRLGVTIGTLKRWRTCGRGPVFLLLGNHVAYHRTDVVAWERERRNRLERANRFYDKFKRLPPGVKRRLRILIDILYEANDCERGRPTAPTASTAARPAPRIKITYPSRPARIAR